MSDSKGLTVILKITERCNINCSYCYYFNGNDQSFKSRPPILKQEVIHNVVKFLKQGIIDLEIKALTVILHGGEPLLMPKDNFEYICNHLRTDLEPLVENFSIGIQTNGTLINQEWIEILKKHKIRPGLSIDGPKEYHDIYRLSHKGNGTYDKVEKAIKLLQKNDYPFSVLSVVNPHNNPEVVYNHFANVLKIETFDFIIPYVSHDAYIDYTPELLGEYITKLFKLWTEQDNPNIKMRLLHSYINMFLGKTALIYGHYGNFKEEDLHLIMIRSDGDISTSDELMSTDPLTVTMTGKNVTNTTLEQFFSLPIFRELEEAFENTPALCKTCCWENICGGGEIVNRFSKANRFNNPSVFCEGLKILYQEIFRYLIKSGIKIEDLKQQLVA